MTYDSLATTQLLMIQAELGTWWRIRAKRGGIDQLVESDILSLANMLDKTIAVLIEKEKPKYDNARPR